MQRATTVIRKIWWRIMQPKTEKTIGGEIKKKRMAKGMTPAQLGEHLGLKGKNANDWILGVERGAQVIRKWQAKKIAAVLGGPWTNYFKEK